MGFVWPRPTRALCTALMEPGSNSQYIEIIRNAIGLCFYTIAEVLEGPCLPPGWRYNCIIAHVRLLQALMEP